MGGGEGGREDEEDGGEMGKEGGRGCGDDIYRLSNRPKSAGTIPLLSPVSRIPMHPWSGHNTVHMIREII